MPYFWPDLVRHRLYCIINLFNIFRDPPGALKFQFEINPLQKYKKKQALNWISLHFDFLVSKEKDTK